MLRTLIRRLAAAVVVCALLAPATAVGARTHPHDDPAVAASPSLVGLFTAWLGQVWNGLFTASTTEAGDEDGETPAVVPGEPPIPQSSVEDGGERGPYIDPNG